MEIVVLVIAAVVAIDALARFDARRKTSPPRDETTISTQKIVIDLSKRL